MSSYSYIGIYIDLYKTYIDLYPPGRAGSEGARYDCKNIVVFSGMALCKARIQRTILPEACMQTLRKPLDCLVKPPERGVIMVAP